MKFLKSSYFIALFYFNFIIIIIISYVQGCWGVGGCYLEIPETADILPLNFRSREDGVGVLSVLYVSEISLGI